MMDAVRTSETSVYSSDTSLLYIPEVSQRLLFFFYGASARFRVMVSPDFFIF
jgi:hypothetical protein